MLGYGHVIGVGRALRAKTVLEKQALLGHITGGRLGGGLLFFGDGGYVFQVALMLLRKPAVCISVIVAI